MRSTTNSNGIVIAASFVAEPIGDTLAFWLDGLGLAARPVFAPQSQLLQTLLDPLGAFAANRAGLNVALLRWEDLGASERGVQDVLAAVRASASRAGVEHLVVSCPPSPGHVAAPRTAEWDAALEAALADVPRVQVLTAQQSARPHPAQDVHDAVAARAGLVPYSAAFYAALATAVARAFHEIVAPPYKAIVLDCDGTLWDGVCGEQPPESLRFGAAHREWHERLVAQRERGMLLCLCSRNADEDVAAVFAARPDLPLRASHFTARRIDWAPKPDNLLAIAQELGLATSSLVFIDDDPVQCAHVRQALPEVLTLQLPTDESEWPGFFDRVWAFDRRVATEEDRARSGLYELEQRRAEQRRDAASLDDFLASLELEVEFPALDAPQLPRASQLSFRVTQFNFTGVRRSEAELSAQLAAGTLEGFMVNARDRFGDYGSVGVVLYARRSGALLVDWLLLSCRALGRNIEQRLMNRLGAVAVAGGCATVELRVSPTARNAPARDFVKTHFPEHTRSSGGDLVAVVPAAVLAALHPVARPCASAAGSGSTSATPPLDAVPVRRAQALARIASDLKSAEDILAAVAAGRGAALAAGEGAPRSDLERRLVAIWEEVLGVGGIGAGDNFFELGGDSLSMVRVISRLHAATGIEVPITRLFEWPTIEEQARQIERTHEEGSHGGG